MGVNSMLPDTLCPGSVVLYADDVMCCPDYMLNRAVLCCVVFRYQPRHNIMVSSEFGTPNFFFQGFDPAVANTEYGR